MTELRKCPFCGGEATIYEDRHENIIYGYNVACDNCCATIFADTEEEAIEAWNKRVSCDTCAMYFPDDGCMAGLVDEEVKQ